MKSDNIPRTKVVMVRFTPQEKEALENLAKQDERSVSGFLRTLFLRAYKPTMEARQIPTDS